MARKRRWFENMEARFAEGTFARIEAVLTFAEDRTDFIRVAVEREIKRRKKLTVEQRAREAVENNE
jgi:hypothetical protein